MNQLHKQFGASLIFAAILVLFTGMTNVNAQENILGDWVFTMEMPDMGGGMGGPGGGMGMPAITINTTFTKGDDGKVTGTWEMSFEMPEGMGDMGGPGGGMGGPGGGMGDFQMPTFKIVNVKIDGQKLSFTRTTEGDAAGGMGGGMMTEDREFTGTIKGDAIELTSSSQMGEMTYKGTRSTGAAAASSSKGLEGDWEFEMTIPDTGMGMGQMDIVINAKVTKDAQGKYAMAWDQKIKGDTGGGMGMTNPEVKIEDVKLDGNKVTFVEKLNFGDAMGMGEMTANFAGTLNGDVIEGKLSMADSGMGGPAEYTLKGKRKGAAATAASATGLEGTWEFVTLFGEGDMGMEIKANATFTKAADGKYSCKWESLPMEGGMDMGMEVTVTLSDIKLDGEKLTFVQKVDMGGMGEMILNYSGTLKGDKIEGVFSSDMGDSKSTATRKGGAAAPAAAGGSDALTGDWELTMTMPDMGMGMGEMKFNIKSTVTKGADGKYAMTWEQSMEAPEGMGDMGGGMGGMEMPAPTVKIEDIKLDGEKLTFVQKVSFGDMGGMGMGGPEGGMEMASNFTGTVKGGAMEGKMVGQDTGGDMGGMGGMPPMEFTIKGTKK